MTELRIIFMGTPDFAVASLEILLEHHFNVVAVVTAPDKPQGRGQKLVHSPVKECALRHNLPVLQPANLKSAEFIESLHGYAAALQVVVAFRMLPEAVWSMPSLGTINLHASLLPQYRGAAPIHWAIINGETETGVTTFLLQHEIDTGRILFQEREPIHETDTVGDLYSRLQEKGARLILRTVQSLQSGQYQSFAQPDATSLKRAPKIFKDTCEIDWKKTNRAVKNFVRGLNPFPGAWCILNGKQYKIFGVSEGTAEVGQGDPGAIFTDNKNYLCVKTLDGWISIDQFQPEGKRKMSVGEFFSGNSI
jgi:methionyl-tRNA formyltransferase